MTFSERAEVAGTVACNIRTGCGMQVKEDKGFFAALLSREDEVVVFKLDNATGRYDMSTACCEAVLPPLK